MKDSIKEIKGPGGNYPPFILITVCIIKHGLTQFSFFSHDIIIIFRVDAHMYMYSGTPIFRTLDFSKTQIKLEPKVVSLGFVSL